MGLSGFARCCLKRLDDRRGSTFTSPTLSKSFSVGSPREEDLKDEFRALEARVDGINRKADELKRQYAIGINAARNDYKAVEGMIKANHNAYSAKIAKAHNLWVGCLLASAISVAFISRTYLWGGRNAASSATTTPLTD